MATVGENIFIIDPQFFIRKTSRRLRLKVGAESDKPLVGHPCYKLFFALETPCANCPVARCIAFRTPIEEEIPNNSHAKRLVKATPVLDEQQRVTLVIVDCIDDSTVICTPAPTLAEASAMDTLPDLAKQMSAAVDYRVVLIDSDFNILLMSKSTQLFLRGSQSSAIGQNLFSAVPQYSQAAVREQIERFVADEFQEAFTFSARADFYSEEWIEHTLIRLSMRGRTGAMMIISGPQRQPAEKERHGLKKERMRVLSAFSSKIAHEFRNHLAPITTDIEFLKSDMVSSNSVEGMFKSLDHIGKLQVRLNEMLATLDMLEAIRPHSSSHITEIDVGQLVNRAATVALVGRPFPANDIVVTVGQDLPFLYGVEVNLDRALVELLRALLIVGGEQSKLRVSVHFIHEKKGQFVIKIRVNSAITVVADLDALLDDFITRGRMEKAKISFLTAYAAVLNHDGSMELFKLTDEETEVLIKLPRMTKI